MEYLLKRFWKNDFNGNHNKSYQEETARFHGQTRGKEVAIVKRPGE